MAQNEEANWQHQKLGTDAAKKNERKIGAGAAPVETKYNRLQFQSWLRQ